MQKVEIRLNNPILYEKEVQEIAYGEYFLARGFNNHIQQELDKPDLWVKTHGNFVYNLTRKFALEINAYTKAIGFISISTIEIWIDN